MDEMKDRMHFVDAETRRKSDIAASTWSNTKKRGENRGFESWPFAVAKPAEKGTQVIIIRTGHTAINIGATNNATNAQN
jgi:hypothetical protein